MTETNNTETAILADTQNTSESTPVEETPYAIVVVFSRWTLGQLGSFLQEEMGVTQEQVGFMRIDRHDNKETNRTILLVDREVLDAARRRGFTEPKRGLDFRMCEYELREHNYPREGYTTNLFVRLPESISGEFARRQLENSFEILNSFGFKLTPTLAIPLKSRESAEHWNKLYVTFPRGTSQKEIALARVLLHDTRLYLEEDSAKFERLNCSWAWDNKSKQQNKSQSKGKTQGKQPAKGQGQSKAPSKGQQSGKTQKPSKGKQSGKTEKAVPPKTGPVKTDPVPVRALAPGENQWTKPLVPLQDSEDCCLTESTTCCQTTACETGCCPTEGNTECQTAACCPGPVTEQQVNPLEFPTLK